MDTKHENASLTAIVLCYNAEDTLLPCLNSLKFADEVLVADDGSSDESVKIAKEAGAKVIHLNPSESFAEKRNQTLAHVHTGWVLFVDADEVVTSALARKIRSALEYSDADGFFLARRDIFLGRHLSHGETGSMWLLRLARVDRGQWKRTVHEVWDVSGRVVKLSGGELLHTPHPTIASFIDTLNLYTDLEIRERSGSVAPPVVWLQLFTYPAAKFIQNYFFRLGFLDGIPGFIHAYCMSLHSLLTRIKILEYVRSR